MIWDILATLVVGPATYVISLFPDDPFTAGVTLPEALQLFFDYVGMWHQFFPVATLVLCIKTVFAVFFIEFLFRVGYAVFKFLTPEIVSSRVDELIAPVDMRTQYPGKRTLDMRL